MNKEWILSQTRPRSKVIVKVLNLNLNFILDLILDLLLPDYWSCRRFSSESAVQSVTGDVTEISTYICVRSITLD